MGAALCCDGGGPSTGKMAHLDQTPVAASMPPDLDEKGIGDSHEDQVVPEELNSLTAMSTNDSTSPSAPPAPPAGSSQPPPDRAKVPIQETPEVEEPKRLPPESENVATDEKPNPLLEKPEKPEEHFVSLQRQGEKLGIIVFNRPGEDRLRIGAIKKGGLVDKWNAANPQSMLQPRNIIVEVNGFVKSEEMRAAIADERVNDLHLSIRPALP
mmetsp:Transcript_48486/g.113489  ORF Transcript_48486/g.113489 Transcript_48486/m.113489 type:complete len:212 (+) Transcript_48486:99-734(+)